MKVLFVCNQGKHRSRTGAEIFTDRYDSKYAGVYSEENPLTKELLEWSDLVIVMEDEQRKIIGERFPKQYLTKKIISLNIPDIYSYMQPELKQLIKIKIKQYL